MGIFKIKPEKIKYTDTSKIDSGYTEKMNREYNWMAKEYDAFMIVFPLWKKWIKKLIPYIKGKKILEVSFGSGYLMTQYAKNDLDIHGIDYNEKMLEITSKKMLSKKINAKLSKAVVIKHIQAGKKKKYSAIYLMKERTGATNKQIGEIFGRKNQAIAKTYERFRKELPRNRKLGKEIKRIERKLSYVKP